MSDHQPVHDRAVTDPPLDPPWSIACVSGTPWRRRARRRTDRDPGLCSVGDLAERARPGTATPRRRTDARPSPPRVDHDLTGLSGKNPAAWSPASCPTSSRPPAEGTPCTSTAAPSPTAAAGSCRGSERGSAADTPTLPRRHAVRSMNRGPSPGRSAHRRTSPDHRSIRIRRRRGWSVTCAAAPVPRRRRGR